MLIRHSSFVLILAAFLVSSCGNSTPRLLKTGSPTNGPDEFSILPRKPLETPTVFSDLPTPTPGGANRTDQNPNADAVVALGGNPAVLAGPAIPASDGALLAHTQRFGVSPNVRTELGKADLAFRRRQKSLFLVRWLTGNRYFAAYRGQSLDQYQELERLRAAGVRTPNAPPRTTR